MEIKEMTIEEVEARTAEISSEVAEADESRLDAMKDELEQLEARKTEIREKAKEANEIRSEVASDAVSVKITNKIEKENRTMGNSEIINTKEYRTAFKNYIITGKDTECRALLTENVGGAVPVPSVVYDIVKNAWEKEGIMALVKKAYIKGNIKVGFEISATGAVIHTEGTAAPSEEVLALGVVELVPASIKKWISISDEVMDMDSGAFLQYVYDEVTYQIAKKAADTLLAKIEACGTVSTNTPSVNVAVPVITEASIAMSTIANAISNLSDVASNPVIVMNKATYASFKAVQAAASYGYDPFESLTVIFNNSIKAYSVASTGDTYAIVGDFAEGALANFPNGEDITIKLDDMSLAEADLVKIVGRQFVAMEVIAPNAFVKIAK